MCCGYLVPVVLLTRPLTRYLSGNYFKDRIILVLFFGTDFWISLALKKKACRGWKSCTCTGRWCNLSCSSLLTTSRWHLKTLTGERSPEGGSEYKANKYLHSLCPWKCSCCVFDAFLEKVKWPLICEVTQETLITLISEASAGFAGDKPWLSWQ